MPLHPYGLWSLAPPLVAVVLAIVTQRVLLSVLVGLFVGALLTTRGDFAQALFDLGEVHLWPTFIEPSKLRLFAFTMAMGATIALLGACGGMRGLVGLMTPLARGPRSGQLTGWGMGLMVFFDDYANTLLVGGGMRAVFDRLRVSREKLAFIVDSTSAPVAGLALVSTWIAVEVAYVDEGLANLAGGVPDGVSGFGLFVACLPYRFYVIQTLVFVGLVAAMGRDFGPMLSAERAARRRDPADVPATHDATTQRTSHWINAVLPLGATVAAVMGVVWAHGRAALGERFDARWSPLEQAREVFGAADSGMALMYGGLVGLAVAIAVVRGRGLLSSDETAAAMVRGVLLVLPAVGILWFAGAMSRMAGNRDAQGAPSVTPYEHADVRLYSGEYVSQLLLGGPGDSPSGTVAAMLPTGVFLMSAVVSFCTGTSFGTMGLMVPIVVPIAFAAAGGGAAAAGTPSLLATLGGVLAGSIFGDHCSPISDTTILSASASGCDQAAHVRTQLPYAALVAAVAILLGTLPVGLGVSVWVLLPLQSAALVAALWWWGQRP